MARSPSQKEIAAFIVGHGITDFVTGGRLSLIERNALWKVLKKLGPPAVTTTGRIAGTAAMGAIRAGPAIASTGRFIAMRHPYIAAAVVTYEVVKNREQIAQLLQEGWQVVQELPGLFEEARDARSEFLGQRPGTYILPSPGKALPRKKRASKFNKAISAGMKAVKRSKFLGKPGKFTNSKTAFSRVTKTVARLRRGVKVAKKGVTGIIARAVRRYI